MSTEPDGLSSPELEPIRREPLPPGPSSAVRLLFSSAAEHADRMAVRERVLRMTPVEEDHRAVEFRAPGVARRGRSLTWKLVGRDGVCLAARVRDFRRGERAVADAQTLVASDRLAAVVVREADTGRHSFWIVRGNDIVLTGASLVGPAARAAVLARNALRALAARPNLPAETGDLLGTASPPTFRLHREARAPRRDRRGALIPAPGA
ncbi:hypothetical protein [Microbacterium album]|uniref:Uncharacterized protein n=1 Tax=Microbacterium album TaxID=2053191 RepID=A0A917IJL6_9MICO|nr:hypothetical protein [Microbacterium album]GGH49894.1 hypothetical protein GCM10010921_28280 [Microbacterium album]